MKNLRIEATKYTPLIDFNAESGVFEIKGKSYPENTFEFYAPVLEWLEHYFEKNNKGKVVLNLEIIYFNSSSSKLFFDLFDLFDEMNSKGKKIEINWYYDKDNDVAFEAGEDFQEDFEELDFTLLVKINL